MVYNKVNNKARAERRKGGYMLFINTSRNLYLPDNLVIAVNKHRERMEEANEICREYPKKYTEEELFNLYLSDYLNKFSFKMTD